MANDDIYQHRLDFARITPEDTALLRQIWPRIAPALPRILTAFYAHITREPHLAAMIGTHESRLQGAQSRHWHMLFTSGSARTISTTPCASVRRITASGWNPNGISPATSSCSMS
ncbi:hypothetical protein ASTA108788_00320 [Asticcacaulis taihuensis]